MVEWQSEDFRDSPGTYNWPYVVGQMAEIRGTCDVSLHQRFRVEQYFNCMGFCIVRNVICIHEIFCIIQQSHKEKLCAGFWVKGFKDKVDQVKSSLYLKRASSLVLTNSCPSRQEK